MNRLWREWCFYRVVFAHFRKRFLLMAIVLGGGALTFYAIEPDIVDTPQKALYYTWSLAFGEPPQSFPDSPWLQILFFIIPVLGLTLIIEGIVDFALMLRDRRRNERSWCTMMASNSRNHIILVGLGRLGFKTYKLLHQMGEQVVVIERMKENQFLEDVRRDSTPLLIGDARREAILSDANVTAARSIILATTDDLANLEIALDAHRANPDIHVVLRMFDQNMADKVQAGLNISIAMSQSAISAPAFAMAAVEPGTINSLLLDDEVVVIQRWEVETGGPLCNRSVGDLLGEYQCSVIERRTRGNGKPVHFPPPDTQLIPGDTLLLQGKLDTLTELRKRAAR